MKEATSVPARTLAVAGKRITLPDVDWRFGTRFALAGALGSQRLHLRVALREVGKVVLSLLPLALAFHLLIGALSKPPIASVDVVVVHAVEVPQVLRHAPGVAELLPEDGSEDSLVDRDLALLHEPVEPDEVLRKPILP